MGPRRAKTSTDKQKTTKWQYDGNYSTIETFTEKVLADVEYETSLGTALLTQVLLVEIIYTKAKCFTKQLYPVMGSLHLTHLIATEATDELIRTIQTTLSTAIDKSNIELIIKRLQTLPDTATETDIQTEIDDIITKSQGKKADALTHDDITRQRDQYINLICEAEPVDMRAHRYDTGKFARTEFMEEFLDEMKENEKQKFITTGKI